MANEKPITVDELKSRSDMVALLDTAMEELDGNKYLFLISINKRGGLNAAAAGFASDLELQGLKIAVPELLDVMLDAEDLEADCEHCEYHSEDEEGEG